MINGFRKLPKANVNPFEQHSQCLKQGRRDGADGADGGGRKRQRTARVPSGAAVSRFLEDFVTVTAIGK